MAKKILVVDDEPELVVLTKARLEASGYEVITAADGEAGLKKAHEEKPDLIILDLMLPKMDGYQICRLLKFDANYSHIPIIMLTARLQDEDKKMGLEVGANAFFTKPFDNQLILAKVKELLAAAKA
ncbi:MAG: response regulator [bacterium]